MKKFSKQEVTEFCKFLREFHDSYLVNENDIECVIEIATQYLYHRLTDNDITLKNFQLAGKYLTFQLANEKSEVFAALFLDAKNRVIKYEKLFAGSVSRCDIYPRVIAQKALELNATKIILAHNHPSGDNKPSQQDIELTKQLQNVLAVFDITVIDHFIIGGQQFLSLACEGYLD